jgi:hypothetical protein
MNQAMEVEKMSNLALLLVLALCMSQPLITTANWFYKRHVVHIENRLSNHALQASCMFEDQDLGLQHISLGKQFQWGFYLNFWESKSYFYNLSWPGGHKIFDAYRHYSSFCEGWQPFSNVDENCVWQARDEGIYLLGYYIPQTYYLKERWLT